MHSALPKTSPSNIIINKTIRATESDTPLGAKHYQDLAGSIQVKIVEELLCPLSHCPCNSMQHALQTCGRVPLQFSTDWKAKMFECQGHGHLWPNSHLSGFGWGLNKGNAVAACQVLSLLGVDCPGREVTLVPHQHHGDVLRVLHTLYLFSEHWQRCKISLYFNLAEVLQINGYSFNVLREHSIGT